MDAAPPLAETLQAPMSLPRDGSINLVLESVVTIISIHKAGNRRDEYQVVSQRLGN